MSCAGRPQPQCRRQGGGRHYRHGACCCEWVCALPLALLLSLLPVLHRRRHGRGGGAASGGGVPAWRTGTWAWHCRGQTACAALHTGIRTGALLRARHGRETKHGGGHPCEGKEHVCGPLARAPLHQAAAKLAAEYGSCEEFPRRPAEQGRGGRLACVGWAHLRCAACRAVLRNARSDRPEPKAAGAVPQLRCRERAQRWALPACRLCLYKPCQRANAHAQTAYNRRLAPLVRCSAASPPARQGTYVLLACSAAKVFRAGIVLNPQFGHTAIGQGATVQTLEQYGGESPAFDRGTQQRDAQ